MRHELKTDPKPFQAVWNGDKLYEIRKDDRTGYGPNGATVTATPYEVNDELLLRETEFSGEQMKGGRPVRYTGRQVLSVVTHKLTNYGLQPGWCVLSIRRLELIDKKGPHNGGTWTPQQPPAPVLSDTVFATERHVGVKTRDPMHHAPHPPTHWVERFGMPEAVARMHSKNPLFCMGPNCFSDGSTPHSPECIAEHAATFIESGKPHSLPTALAVAWDGDGMPYCHAHGRNTHVLGCKTCKVTLDARIGMMGDVKTPAVDARKVDVPVAVDRRIDAKLMPNGSGHHVSYYAVDVQHTTKGGPLYRAEAMDIIDALDMTFAEGEAFKAVWRCAADRIGAHKEGNDTARDAEKVMYYGEQMLARERRRAGKA
jgi:hypothetical protein